ncbi:MAG TPA: class I SAM-dependent methyltransferase [Candidatus Eisenbacteria bacterium]|nr:class I SAM-dependent methyltransferase [Candidatus Eisenbacteria bacterium]
MRASTEAHWTRFWRERAAIDDVYPTAGQVAERILDEGPVEGARVLEVGAGSGRDSVTLAARGATVVLLDYSMASLEVARDVARRSGVRPLLVRADALRMPFREGTFDTVFHQGLLEHFRDPMPLLRENVRALKPDGILVVDVPQRYHLYTAMKRVLIAMGKWFAGWETEFTIGQLTGLMARAGVRVTRRYGAFMVPGLAYRSLRLGLLKLGLAKLPLEPPPVPLWTPLMARIRAAWERTPLAFHTYFVIGAVGRKGTAPDAGARRD